MSTIMSVDTTSLIPSSYSIPLCPRLLVCCGNDTQVKLHVTFIIFFIIVVLASLQYVSTFPLYIVLTIILYGPVLIISLLVHARGHLRMTRHLFGSESRHNNNTIIILWPFGEYNCDALSSSGEEEEEQQIIRGSIRDDIKISIAGPIMHIPLCLFWFAMYAAVNNGNVSDFISYDPQGFFSTLFRQACLMNLLIMWLNIFIPTYPLDGSRILTSTMLLMGVALNKAALLTCFVSFLISIALFCWSVYVFADDGVGGTGILTILLSFFIFAECRRVYRCIVNGTLRQHPLFGRDVYIYRDARPSIFQMSSAARNISTNTDRIDGEHNNDTTIVATETDVDQVTNTTDID